MKRLFCLILVLCMTLLYGCGGESNTTEAPTETTAIPTEAPVQTTAVPTEAPTEATEPPTEPTGVNPLTGETMDAPHDSRIFAISINNVPAALPHYGVSKADLFFEMFVNDFAVRGLALYADITEVESVGSVRSLRYNFTDICQAYDAIVVHASGSAPVLGDLARSGVPNISAESEVADYHYRDQKRLSAGYAWEHCLFVRGPEMKAYAESKGIEVTRPVGTTYGLNFTEDGTPADGEDAGTVVINFTKGRVVKPSTMIYSEETGLYSYNQYGKVVQDGYYEVDEGFENVIVMLCEVRNETEKSSVYHIAELIGEGDGYFACGGKIIPIRWSRAADNDPFHYTRIDGTPLNLGIGSSYIAFAPTGSTVTWE